MLGFDPTIVEHHIDTWLDAPPIRHKKVPMHSIKAMVIKAKIEKLCQAKFIFPVKYTS